MSDRFCYPQKDIARRSARGAICRDPLIRGVDEDLIVTQELASMNGMYNTVTGEDLFNELKKNI